MVCHFLTYMLRRVSNFTFPSFNLSNLLIFTINNEDRKEFEKNLKKLKFTLNSATFKEL